MELYLWNREKSEHLIGNAIRNFIEGSNINAINNQIEKEFECKYWTSEKLIPHSGFGVTGIYKNNIQILIGNFKYMNKYNIKYKKIAKYLTSDTSRRSTKTINISIILNKVKSLEMNGNTCVFISCQNELSCILSIADKIKSDAKYAINYLQNKLNIECWLGVYLWITI